ncbi:transposase, partial [Roseomonas mucosa]|uniref:transposase n=1 Tax=Roseomonas mucosa TaxID=207340 RepID=UPI001EF583B2
HDPRHRGRPVAEGPRARMDAIFAHALTPLPWSALPAQHGRTDTIARFFRRLTHAGVWGRLLTVLATLPAQHPLQSLRHRICRAARRAYRILGMGLILLARRLNLRSALPGPPWLLPDPDLSETLRQTKIPPFPTRYGTLTAYRDLLKTLAALHRAAAGCARLPNRLRHAWP